MTHARTAQQEMAKRLQDLERTVEELQARSTKAEQAQAAAEARAVEQARQIAHYESQAKSPRKAQKSEEK